MIFSDSYAESLLFSLFSVRAVVHLIQSLDQLVHSLVQLVRQTGTGVGKEAGGAMNGIYSVLPMLSFLFRSLYLACCRHLRYARG